LHVGPKSRQTAIVRGESFESQIYNT